MLAAVKSMSAEALEKSFVAADSASRESSAVAMESSQLLLTAGSGEDPEALLTKIVAEQE
jgi:hypothetical protein